MRFVPEHEVQSIEEVLTLVKAQTMLGLVSVHENQPRFGLYNFILKDQTFYIHLGKKDEQLLHLRANPIALITFSQVLSVIPSFWIDERYGGAINNFFRYVEFECEAIFLETPEEILPLLKDMLEAYQEERRYEPLDTQSAIYRPKFAMLSVVELKIRSMRTKWNLGQTKPREAFRNAIAQLEKRKGDLDLQTASEMRKLNLV